jgi:uncharacterized protein YprB with RNaseH-like and TPR domain
MSRAAGMRRAEPALPRPSGPLEQLVNGSATGSGDGFFYRVTEEATEVLSDYLETIASPSSEPQGPLAPLAILQATPSSSVCYLDIETTGLGNAPLFLIGLMYQEGEALIIDQLFARDYTEERPVLDFVRSFLDRYDLIVTFNGDRFDIPFIRERMAFFGIEFDPSVSSLDLLPVSRSLLGTKTPNHKLQTLERYVLGRKRIGDIPGADIPGAYHDFVRTGDAGQMQLVLHHNKLDLLSMLELVTAYLSSG